MRHCLSFFLSERLVSVFCLVALLTGCASVEQIGEIGPKKLKVYSVSHNDFLSASRMLVVLNEKGDLGATTGGTVSGAGIVGLQAATSVVSSGAILYGAKAIEHGMENAHVKGIPSNVNLNANANINANLHASGEIIHHDG
ncbi:MAG: hypothetical protein ABI597_08155 [Gammaproteobacteria bacterium]